jgi:hypothetical protein
MTPQEITFDFACQDDCLGKMVPADLRRLVSERDVERDANRIKGRELEALRARVAELEAENTKLSAALEGWNYDEYLLANANLRAAIERLLRSVPVAADCPYVDENIVVYRDREWYELCAATDAAKEALR